jgi:hypothetical protein
VLASVIAFTSGCAEKYEQVGYEPADLPAPVTVITVPEWERGDVPGPPRTIPFSDAIKQGESLAFVGRIHAPRIPNFGIVVLEVRAPIGSTTPVVVASGQTECERDGTDGFKYRIEITAPRRGKQRCGVLVTDVLRNVVARGEFQVD